MANVEGSTVQTAFNDQLSVGGFRFFVKRLPKLSFAVQAVNIPSVSLESPSMPTPFVSMPYAGDHIEYGDLRLSYLIDDRFANYVEIHDWARALGKPAEFEEYAAIHMEPGTGVASECTLVVLDGKRNPRVVVSFRDAVPTSLSDIMFDSRISGVQYAQVTCSFRYTEFDVEVV